MQISVENTSTLERRMRVQVPAQRVQDAINTRLQSLSRTVRMNGFRPGKVPMQVVRQQYGPSVRQEVIEALVQTTFNEAVNEQKLNPAGGPQIDEFKADEGQDLSYSAVFEIYPQITIQGVETLAITRLQAEVNDADVDDMVDNLRRQRATYTKVERPAQKDDRITIDFEGKIDGVAFEGGKGENFPVVVGSGRMLAEFEAGLLGMTAGSTKTVDVPFPADYQAANLAGKTAQFTLTAHQVEEQQLPAADDEFATQFGITEGGIATLRQEVADNLKREATDKARTAVRQQLFDGLLAANNLDVPSVLISNQVREMQMNAGRQMGAREAAQLPSAEQFQEPARKRVALGLLLGELIRTSGVKVDQEKVTARLKELVQQFPEPEQALKRYRDSQEAMQQLESMVLEEQLIDWMLSRAQVTDRSVGFKELINTAS